MVEDPKEAGITFAEGVRRQLAMVRRFKWRLAYRDRGMGHGDYGVLREDRSVLAEMLFPDEAFLIAHAPRLLKALKKLLEAQPSVPHSGGTLQRVVAHYADGSTQTIEGAILFTALKAARSALRKVTAPEEES